MGVVIGVVIGYALGTRAGPDGLAELKQAWKVISSSDEARDMVATVFSVMRDVLGRGSEILAGALGGGENGAGLRRVA
jgi:hypothetical protein